MNNLKELEETYLRLYQELENDNLEVEQEIYDLEQQIDEELSYGINEMTSQLQQLKNKIKSMKKEFDIYDEESELDMMFPDRHNEDFNEESMNPKNFFDKD